MNIKAQFWEKSIVKLRNDSKNQHKFFSIFYQRASFLNLEGVTPSNFLKTLIK